MNVPLSRVSERTWRNAFRADAASEQGNECAYCYSGLDRTNISANHIEPQSRGGQTTRENISAACRPCNVAKGSRTKAQFLALIKNPPAGAPLPIWRAWMRRRINLAAKRSCRRILKAVNIQRGT